jgi:ABC-2 type transport system ATP-binding protein
MIQLSSVSKYYGSFLAVDSLSLDVGEGEITGLLGPNGAGKTTTMRMITGYFKPTEGTVTVDGIDVVEEPERIKAMIGYLPESPPLYHDMIAYDYLRYIAGVRQIEDPQAIERTAEICGITSMLHKRIGELSKGYRQRVGLAQAIIHDPQILILDEPTSGLDPNQIAEVRALIKEIGKTKTVILSTHILQEVEAVADRVIIINQGRIVKDDTTGNLQAARGGLFTYRIALSAPSAPGAAAPRPDAFLTIDGVGEVKQIDGEKGLSTFQLSAGVNKEIRPAIFETVTSNGWTLYEMSREKHSLEAIFRDLTTGGEDVQHD